MAGVLFGIVVALIIAFCAVACITNNKETVGIVLLLCDVGFICIFCICTGLFFSGAIKIIV